MTCWSPALSQDTRPVVEYADRDCCYMHVDHMHIATVPVSVCICLFYVNIDSEYNQTESLYHISEWDLLQLSVNSCWYCQPKSQHHAVAFTFLPQMHCPGLTELLYCWDNSNILHINISLNSISSCKHTSYAHNVSPAFVYFLWFIVYSCEPRWGSFMMLRGKILQEINTFLTKDSWL